MSPGRPAVSARRARRRRAVDVATSLSIGDHTHLRHPLLRALAGLACLTGAAVVNTVRRAREDAWPDTDLFVVANPVAHGARLVAAVRPTLPTGTAVVADRRLADIEVSRPFPGVGIRSMVPVVTVPRLVRAVGVRMSARRPAGGARSRLYAEYLFLVQAMRFDQARRLLRGLSAGRLLLVDFDRDAYVAPLLAAAGRRLTTVTLVHGSPTQTYLPSVAAHVLVWGEAQRSWFAAHAPGTTPHVVGRPDVTEADAPRRGRPPCLIVAHSCETLVDGEAEAVLRLIRGAAAHGMPTQLRLHPSDPEARRGAGWDPIRRASAQVVVGDTALESMLGSEDIVVAVTSSAAIDAFVHGVRVHVVASPRRTLPVDLQRIREGQTDPFGHAAAADPARETVVVARGSAAQLRMRDALRAILAGGSGSGSGGGDSGSR